MKQEIFVFHDSSMARQEWYWKFVLETEEGKFVLSAEQSFDCGEEEADPLEIEPKRGLKSGADIYEALRDMLGEIFEDIENIDLMPISVEIAKFDAKTADQFSRGQKLLERRDQRRHRKNQKSRDNALQPFRTKIDEYCAKLDDSRTRGGGGVSRPSERTRVRAFLEHYLLENGELPRGHQKWRLGNGFLSGERDFSDLN